MNAVLVGAIVAGSTLVGLVVLFVLMWVGSKIEKSVTGDPFSGFLGGLLGLIVWVSVLLGCFAGLTTAGVFR